MTTMNGPGLPASWQSRVRALTRGELTPVGARPSATVLLLRDTAGGGPAVHMLRRHASMAFAGGMYAYPGGAVDPRDERPVRWAGPSLEWWADALGVQPAQAQAVVCAAVRETFEESGVLLAGPDGGAVVADTTGADWEADRAALVAHELSFADFLARRALVLRSDLLGPWARWITPEFEERRYDTWFFLALLPAGQRARDVSGEADRTVWLRPAEAAEGYASGEMIMLPPTIAMLRDLLPYESAAAALAAAAGRDMTPVLAKAAVDAAGEVVLSWPGHEEFTRVFPAEAEAGAVAPEALAGPVEPVAPVVPEAADVRATPAVSVAEPGEPVAPQVPVVPEAPAESAVRATPAVSVAEPGKSVAPQVPVTAEAADAPAEPAVPATLAVSGAEPGEPAAPEAPVIPEAPAEPAAPAAFTPPTEEAGR